jgi:hypothetical protein
MKADEARRFGRARTRGGSGAPRLAPRGSGGRSFEVSEVDEGAVCGRDCSAAADNAGIGGTALRVSRRTGAALIARAALATTACAASLAGAGEGGARAMVGEARASVDLRVRQLLSDEGEPGDEVMEAARPRERERRMERPSDARESADGLRLGAEGRSTGNGRGGGVFVEALRGAGGAPGTGCPRARSEAVRFECSASSLPVRFRPEPPTMTGTP